MRLIPARTLGAGSPYRLVVVYDEKISNFNLPEEGLIIARNQGNPKDDFDIISMPDQKGRKRYERYIHWEIYRVFFVI